MLVGAAGQLLAYDLSYLVKGHLDARTPYSPKVSLDTFILLTPDHETTFPSHHNGDKRSSWTP
jgi:hypothetical protein